MRRLRQVVSGDPAFTRSPLERQFLDLVDRAELPRPRVNEEVEGIEVDFHWRECRIIVETDGFATHTSKKAFEQDRGRDGVLTRAGYQIHRLTRDRIENHPEAVAGLMGGLVSSPAPRGVGSRPPPVD